MKPHPLSTLFPPMSDQELQELAKDIKINGLRTSIVLHEDKILDGVQRERACELANVQPTYMDFRQMEGLNTNGPLAYVVSENLHRRHLHPSDYTILINKLVPAIEEQFKADHDSPTVNRGRKRPQGGGTQPSTKRKAIKQVAKMLNTTEKTVYEHLKKTKPKRFKSRARRGDPSCGLTRKSSLDSLLKKAVSNGGKIYVEVGNYAIRVYKLGCR
jgi:ParB-like chromosome segregation protein Spo0J